MKKDRTELENYLKEAIERIKYKRKTVENVNKSLSEYDIPHGFFNEVVKKGSSLLQEIDNDVLCLLTMSVFEVDGSSDIRTEDYFTDGEIEQAKKYKSDDKQSLVTLPIVLDDVVQIDYVNYITKIKMSELVKWYNAKLIIYDFESQRSPKYKKGKHGGGVPVPDVNLESVKEIAEHMLNETYIPDTMTLNVYSEESEAVSYNSKTRKLALSEDAIITILDGFHRLQGAVRAASQNPELEQYIGLEIKTFDTETAKRYFGQKNTINVVKKERLDELKQEKVSYVTVKHLQMNSDLKGKISSGSRVLTLSGHITTVDILANSINDIFEPKNTFEAREVGNYLADFYNYLIGMFPEEFESKKGDNYITHPKMFIGYNVIAKQFQDNNIPLKRIKEAIEALNINKNNKELIEVLSNNRGTTSRIQRQVKEYFERFNIKEILNIGA